MNNKCLPFIGFSDPNQFYKLGHSWFREWKTLHTESLSQGRNSIIIVEFFIKSEWIIEKTERKGCSKLEIKRGFLHPNRHRIGSGTQLSSRAINKSITFLVNRKLVNETKVDGKSVYRINREYFPEIFPEIDSLATNNKKSSVSTFFKVPNEFSELCKETGSLGTILTMEYFFRHSWGYGNKNGVWLTVDEIQHGREYRSGKKYDEGIGFDKSTIYLSLKECCEKGWIRKKSKEETGFSSDLFNLNFGEVIENLECDLNANQIKEEFISANESEINIKTEIVYQTKVDFPKTIIDIPKSKHIYQNVDWVLPDSSCVNADVSWVNAYSFWINAEPFWEDVTNSDRVHIACSCVDVSPILENVTDNCANARGFCEDDHDLQVKETSNIQNLKTDKETTTTRDVSIFKQRLAVAVVGGNQESFLLSIGIFGEPIEKILSKKYSDEFLFAWGLFNSTNHEFKDKSEEGFIVKRLRKGHSPPQQCLAIGRLSVEDWLDLVEIIKNHYSQSIEYVEQRLRFHAMYIRKNFFKERISTLPQFLIEFMENIQQS